MQKCAYIHKDLCMMFFDPSCQQNVPTGPNNKPKLPILIAQCGEMWSSFLTTPESYDLCVHEVVLLDTNINLHVLSRVDDAFSHGAQWRALAQYIIWAIILSLVEMDSRLSAESRSR